MGTSGSLSVWTTRGPEQSIYLCELISLIYSEAKTVLMSRVSDPPLPSTESPSRPSNSLSLSLLLDSVFVSFVAPLATTSSPASSLWSTAVTLSGDLDPSPKDSLPGGSGSVGRVPDVVRTSMLRSLGMDAGFGPYLL